MWGSVPTGIEPISTGRRAGQTASSAARGGRTRALRMSSCAKVCQVNARFQRLFTFFELFCAKRRPRTGKNSRMNQLVCRSWNFRNDTPSNPMSVHDAPRSSPWAGKTRFVIPMPGWSASVVAKSVHRGFFLGRLLFRTRAHCRRSESPRGPLPAPQTTRRASARAPCAPLQDLAAREPRKAARSPPYRCTPPAFRATQRGRRDGSACPIC